MSVPGAGIDEPVVGVDERAALQAFLTRQRELVVWKLADCEAGVLQAVATPGGMTALGVVQHLTDVERSWWRDDLLGEPGLTFGWSHADPDGEFRVDPAATTASVLAAYEAECGTCDAAVVGVPLDRVGVKTRFTARWIYLHLIEETARHLGHLDALREQADASVGEEPPRPSPAAALSELSVAGVAGATPRSDNSRGEER